MKKIPSLFIKDDRGLATPKMSLAHLWVVNPDGTNGEGVATVKFDGTACMITEEGRLFKRYDRKPGRRARKKRRKHDPKTPFISKDFKVEPPGWIPCEDEPNLATGHWPGWIPVDFDSTENKWHREAWERTLDLDGNTVLEDKSYELVGPKIQGNPYGLEEHQLWPHGTPFSEYTKGMPFDIEPPRTFVDLDVWFAGFEHVEGIVWWHPDGRMAKVKRVDFGLPWPPK